LIPKEPLMSRGHRSGWKLFVVAVVLWSLIAVPVRAYADGIALPSDPEVWAQLEEGQQIAVVRLEEERSVQVDLFVSMLDRSGEAHRVAFLLPLGLDAERFAVEETTSRSFDERVTEELDTILREETRGAIRHRTTIRLSLLSGTLLINGGWSWPIWYLALLSGCAADIEPVGTFETPSSSIEVYDTGELADLTAFVESADLDPSVREVLERVRGQHVAVVNLRTVASPSGGAVGDALEGQPGIHMRWRASVEPASEGSAYAYPLGTGSGWNHPITHTRVYVVAPPSVDFDIAYPPVGEDLSGYERRGLLRLSPKILEARDRAFAVENASGSFGRVWRVTYHKSNASEDIRIFLVGADPGEGRGFLEQERLERILRIVTLPASLLLSTLIWVLSWRLIMGRFLGTTYGWFSSQLWGEAVGWAMLYPFVNLGALALGAALMALLFLAAGIGGAVLAPGLASYLEAVPMLLGLVLLALTATGAASAFYFGRLRKRTQGLSRWRAAGAYLLVVLLANLLYLALAAGYAALVDVL
jgi:hypothetical protein